MHPITIGPEQFLSVVEAAIQAPSADNHHPLLFDQAGGAIQVWTEQQLATVPFHRRVLLLLSLGAVAENILLKLQSLGFEGRLQWFPDPPKDCLVARIELRRCEAREDELASKIAERHTNRRFFHGPALSGPQLAQLESDASADGARLVWLDARHLRRKVLKLIRMAEEERFRAKPLHAEMFSSIRFEVGWKDTTEDGLAPGALEVEKPLRPFFRALRRWRVMRALTLVGGHRLLALRAADALCRLSPHLGVLTTDLDVERGALAVGQALQRVWLRTTTWNLALQPLAASTLLALDGYQDIRPALRTELAQGWSALVPGVLPLIVFRLGRSTPASLRSGRRPPQAHLRRS